VMLSVLGGNSIARFGACGIDMWGRYRRYSKI